jgi:hypothetical protein
MVTRVDQSKPMKIIPYSPPVCEPLVTSNVFGGGDVIKVNHVSVEFDKSVMTTQAHQEPMKPQSKEGEFNLLATLQGLRCDLDHQKRLQQEQALKMEQQYARLASKVEGLASGDGMDLASKSSSYDPTDSKLQSLTLQMQKDTVRDSHDMRQLLQQMNQQCVHLANQVECLTNEVKKRDDHTVRLEASLKAKESQYFEKMEVLRGEMERRLERQQQIFTDKISQAMLQMERLASADRVSKSSVVSRNDSTASLESLPPMEQVNTGTGAYSMRSGIRVFGGPVIRK